MRILDVTRDIMEGGVVFPGDPETVFRQIECDGYRITEITMGSHSGTHIDAPLHYIRDGMTIESIPPDILCGPVRVIDLSGAGQEIRPEDLRDYVSCGGRLLIRTSFSGATEFSPDYQYLSLEAARLLTSSGICCVGTDAPSVEAFDGSGDVHRELLGRGTAIIELLDLTGVPEGEYFMAALPLRLKGLDGAPARVVLFETDTDSMDVK